MMDFLALRCAAKPACVVKRFVHIECAPEVMQQHGEFSRHSNRRSFACVLTSSCGDGETVSPQITIGAEGPKHVLR